MAVCCQGQNGEEWVIIAKYGRRLERSWEYSFYFECDLKLLVKATGVILLLGVGSLVCYKIYNHYWSRPRPRPRSWPNARTHKRETAVVSQAQDSEDQLLEDLEDVDLNNVEGRYFGPSPVPREGVFPTVTSSFPCSRSASGSIYPNSSTSQSDSSTSGEDEGRDADVSDGSQGEKSYEPPHVLQQQQKCHLRWSGDSFLQSKFHSFETSTRHCAKQPPDKNSGWLMDKIDKILTSTPNRLQLQLAGSAWLNLPSSKSTAVSLSCVGARKLVSAPRLDQRDSFHLIESKRLSPEGAEVEQQEGSTTGDSSSTSLAHNLQSCTNLVRDESYDSLGFSKQLPRDGSFDSTFSELSLDFLPESTTDFDTGTMLCMEKLQQEIDQLKTNCQMMDEEFETIKCNRNLPGMSSLMAANASSSDLVSSAVDPNLDTGARHEESSKQEKARACFAGLYSLTTIKNSTSSELSDCFPAPVLGLDGQGSVGSAESLDWDSPKLATSPVNNSKVNISSPARQPSGHFVLEEGSSASTVQMLRSQSIDKSRLAPTPSEDELMANLEWDEEDLVQYPEIEEEGGISIVAVNTLEMDLEAELSSTLRNTSEEPENMTLSRSFTASPNTERSSKVESSSGFESGSKMLDSCTSQMASDLEVKAWACWSSEESGCMEWDTTAAVTGHAESDHNVTQPCWDEAAVSAQSSSNPSELSTPGSENPQSLSAFVIPTALENVGQRVNVSEYAAQEWQGNTKKARTILQGYSEIPLLLGLQHLRRVRGDNYCGVRAAIFQTLAQGLHVPSGEKTFQYLAHAVSNEGCGWLQDWTFAGRLPYEGNNVLHGMGVCLRDLDNVASLLASTNGNREETLVTLLNSDPTLDLHVVEAVKLHMLQCAMELHRGNTSGADDVPLFAMLMFARDTSETPKDLMNNHLREVGNSGGLEQVEMFLLGYTLRVTLRVIRPAAFGTEDFMCSYPDWNEGNWPQVFLIAEDDRHYNVLVQ